MTFKQILLFILLLPVLILLSCSNNSNKTPAGYYTVRDMTGRNVNVPENVNKIIGVRAGTLRLLAYLQVTEMVVGIEEIETRRGKPYNFAFPELAELPVIGPIHGGDTELILAQQPDVIFISYTTQGEADELQAKTGIPVVAIHYGDLDENSNTFYTALRLIAQVTGREKRAEALIKYTENIISDLNKRTHDIPREEKRPVYIGGLSYKGFHGISSTDPGYIPFRFVNALNVASSVSLVSENVMVDKEKIIEWDPEKIFIDKSGYEIVKKELEESSALTGTLKAFKNNEAYMLMPYNYYTTNYSTLLINSYYIGTVLYPDRFGDISLPEKADEIYSTFLGANVYDKIAEMYGEYGKWKVLHE